jgi:hypothetical protein
VEARLLLAAVPDGSDGRIGVSLLRGPDARLGRRKGGVSLGQVGQPSFVIQVVRIDEVLSTMLPVASDREAMALENLHEGVHPSTVQVAEQGSIEVAGGGLAVPHGLLVGPGDLCRRYFRG